MACRHLPGLPKPNPPYDARNMLRPETVESLFIGWRLTHNPVYRYEAEPCETKSC